MSTVEEIFEASGATPLSELALGGVESLEFIPTQQLTLPESLEEFLKNIGVADFEVQTRIHDDGSYTSTASVDLIFARQLSFDVPGLEGFSLVVGSNDAAEGTRLSLGLSWGDEYKFSIGGKIALRFARNILKPVERKDGKKDGEWVAIEGKFSEVSMETTITIDGEGNVSLDTGAIKLAESMIADSGVVISASVVPVFSDDLDSIKDLPKTGRPAFLVSGWRGVYIGSAKVDLPPDINSLGIPDLAFQNCYIGNGGFTGRIEADWTDKTYIDPDDGKTYKGLSGELFGIRATARKLQLEFIQNAFTKSSLEGSLKLPFFDAPIDLLIGFTLDGSFTVKLGSEKGLATLRKEGVIEVKLDSLGFSYEQGLFSVNISGEIKPLVAGLDWPAFGVKELSIDAKGNVKIDGGWLKLRDKYTLDFYGFKFEVTKLGFGRSDDGRKWIGFSGAIRLVDQLPAGVSVEGLRFTWDDGGNVQVSFNGIGVEFAVPNVLKFKGSVSYSEFQQDDPKRPGNKITVHRFDGDINLNIMVANLELDAKLVIGYTEGPDAYTFFAIYLAAELPGGIALGPTGLALYGLAGLFASNMEPDRQKDEEWYGALSEKKGWYTRDPIGVTSLEKKWINRDGSLAIGAGITIGTIFDNGFTFSGKMLLLIVFPGPIIMIEGKANLLRERSQLDKDPVFRVLAVLDFREGSFLFGLTVNYKYGDEGELFALGGSAEIYFSTSRSDDWHIWVGKKEPRDLRIQAKIFRLWSADFYLMVDNKAFAMGSWTGYQADWKFGPVEIILEAWLEWNVLVNWKPTQLHGDVWIHGKIGIKLGPIGLSLSADARLSADAFEPFHILGTVDVAVDLPWPLPDFSFGVQVEWGPEPVPPPLPKPLKEIAMEHPKASITWPLPVGKLVQPVYEATDDKGIVDDKTAGFLSVIEQPEINALAAAWEKKYPPDLPIVPLDARPHLTFGRPVYDARPLGMNAQNPPPFFEQIGDPANHEGPMMVHYELKDVSFETWNEKTGNWEHAQYYAWNEAHRKWELKRKEAYGTWAAVPTAPAREQPAVAQNKLWMFQKNPFAFSRSSSLLWGNWFFDQFYDDYPCLPPPDKDFETCCNFRHAPLQRRVRSPWAFTDEPNLKIFWPPTQEPAIEERNYIAGYERVLTFVSETRLEISIVPPEPVNRVELVISPAAEVSAVGFDAAGTPKYPAIILLPDRVVIEAGAERMTRVLVTREIKQQESTRPVMLTSLAEVCYVVRKSLEPDDWRTDLEKHIRQETKRWAQAGEVFEPHKIYRMTVVTVVNAVGKDSLEGLRRDIELKEYAYFRTEGPPALARLSLPANIPKPGDPPQEAPSPNSFDKTMGGLADLTMYVRQTVPPTVVAEGEQPNLPRPVYRSYDVGVHYNENYVELMYRMAGRDLGIYLFDASSLPARDFKGRLLAPVNRWGQPETVELNEIDRFWLKKKADACAPLDDFTIRRTNILEAGGFLLGPETLYEARLIPAMLHEDFRLFFDLAASKGVSIEGSDSHPVNIGRWTLSTETAATGEFDRHSIWTVMQYVVAASSTMYMTQTSAYSLGSSDTSGPLLWYNPERPHDWSDYRLSAYLRTGGVGAPESEKGGIGLAFRYQRDKDDQPSFYLFLMNNQETNSYRRLLRVAKDTASILAEDKTSYESAKDQLLSIEVIGGEIRVYQNDELVFAVTDNKPELLEQGTVGLYSLNNRNACFSDVRVEDLRTNAPVAYRFKFATSKYANFYHQVHSFQDETWRLAGPDDLTKSLEKAVAMSAEPTVEETQAYEALVRRLLGEAAEREVTELQVSQIERKNEAGQEVSALLLRSPEPLNWQRLVPGVRRSIKPSRVPQIPEALKITKANWAADGAPLNNETVTLLLREDADLSGYELEYRASRPGKDEQDSDWLPYYTFGKEPRLSGGTRVIIHAGKRQDGPSAPFGVVHRFLEQDVKGKVRLPANGFDIRIGRWGHARTFIPDRFLQPVDFKVIRSADSTGLFITVANGDAFNHGHYELLLTYRRDNRATDPASLILSEAGNHEPEEATLAIFVRTYDDELDLMEPPPPPEDAASVPVAEEETMIVKPIKGVWDDWDFNKNRGGGGEVY